jgi:hypothetical protein
VPRRELRNGVANNLSRNDAKGSSEQSSLSLRDAILAAAGAVGDPRRGGDGGLTGYLTWLAANHPRSYCNLLGLVLRAKPPGRDARTFGSWKADVSNARQALIRRLEQTAVAPLGVDENRENGPPPASLPAGHSRLNSAIHSAEDREKHTNCKTVSTRNDQ